MPSYLQIENISKSYGTKVLFDKIAFNINEGDKIALIAPNGTGKTSLMRILAGKDTSDSGGSIKFLKEARSAQDHRGADNGQPRFRVPAQSKAHS